MTHLILHFIRRDLIDNGQQTTCDLVYRAPDCENDSIVLESG